MGNIKSVIIQFLLKLIWGMRRENKRTGCYFSTLALCVISVAEHQGWSPGPCKISGKFAIDFNGARILPWVSTVPICASI